MKTIKLGKKIVEMYDSIEDLPIVRFHKFGKMILVDAGIGSTLSDFDIHLEKIGVYLKNGKTKEAIQELYNMRTNVSFIQNSLSPKMLAFATLVKSIDNIDRDDISDEGLKQTLALLNNMTVSEFEKEFDAVKKKIDSELLLYFPKYFDNTLVIQYYEELVDKINLELDAIIENVNRDDEINEMMLNLMDYCNPQRYDGSDGVEVTHENNFQKTCVSLSKYLGFNVKSLTTLEYYNTAEQMSRDLKKTKK